jgi:hypothetical protein
MRRGAILAGVLLACAAALASPGHAQPKDQVTLAKAFPDLPATREGQHEKVLEAALKAKAAMQAVIQAGEQGDTPAYRTALTEYLNARAGYQIQIMRESYYDPAVFKAEQDFMQTYADYSQLNGKVNRPGPLEDHIRAVAAAEAARKATIAADERFNELRRPVEAAIAAQASRDLGGVYLPNADAHMLWAKGMTTSPIPQTPTAPASGVDTKVEQPTLPPREVFTPSGGASGAGVKAPAPETTPRKPAPPQPEISDELRRHAGVDAHGVPIARGPNRRADDDEPAPAQDAGGGMAPQGP